MMDYRQYEISGATAVSRDAFEQALAAFLSWRDDARFHLERALLESPHFAMAHVLSAYMSVWSRDVNRVRQARLAYASISRLPVTRRELLHHAAIGAALRDDPEMLRTLLDELLERYPRDILALHAGHALDYLTGDLEYMRERVSSVLSAWSADIPGFHSVLTMQAFSAVESARYGLAEEASRAALELNQAVTDLIALISAVDGILQAQAAADAGYSSVQPRGLSPPARPLKSMPRCWMPTVGNTSSRACSTRTSESF